MSASSFLHTAASVRGFLHATFERVKAARVLDIMQEGSVSSLCLDRITGGWLMNDGLELTGRRALVTGGTQGIGQAVVSRLREAYSRRRGAETDAHPDLESPSRTSRCSRLLVIGLRSVTRRGERSASDAA